VGTLNMLLANRLEVTLALANPAARNLQIPIIRFASDVAAATPGAKRALAPESRPAPTA